MARRRKLRKVSLAQPKTEITPLDLRPNVVLNRQSKVISFEFDNPNYDPKKTQEEQPNVSPKIIQHRSEKDPLYKMYAEAGIEKHQLTAGEHWRECYELCQIGGVRGQNLMREYVDISPGFNYDPTGPRQEKAWKDLKKASVALGVIGEVVIKKVLIDGMFPREVAEYMGYTTERRIRHYTDIFKDSLEVLSRTWGTEPSAKLQIRINGI